MPTKQKKGTVGWDPHTADEITNPPDFVKSKLQEEDLRKRVFKHSIIGGIEGLMDYIKNNIKTIEEGEGHKVLSIDGAGVLGYICPKAPEGTIFLGKAYIAVGEFNIGGPTGPHYVPTSKFNCGYCNYSPHD